MSVVPEFEELMMFDVEVEAAAEPEPDAAGEVTDEAGALDPQWDALMPGCPTRQVLDRIGERWTMLVVMVLADEERVRFNELRRRVGGVTQKMLTQTLRGMQRDGLVDRFVTPTVPVTVEYSLTPLGRGLGQTISVVRHWAYTNMEEIAAARVEYDASLS